ncbi:sphingomyelin synthase-related protein 1 [Hoplias malabaricus]|uniref:sphingomyelin synthase-related protein 1 n=1 Tax=Hoplias malabaricus TaxID=27720 RepID=UPI003462DF15
MVGCEGAELWSSQQVSFWLKDQGFAKYVDLLCVKHKLDGAGLLNLTENDLRSPPLQLPLLGDIKRLTLALKTLQRQHTLTHTYSRKPNSLSPSRVYKPKHYLYHAQVGGDCNGTAKAATFVREDSCDGYSNEKCKGHGDLDPEYWKTALIFVYVTLVFGITSFIMVLVHEKVPDIHTYPPLPDIFLDSVPRIPWAFAMAEACAVVLGCILLLTLLLHKHRSILFRRFCSLMGTVFLLRCVTMFVTSLSVPGHHLQCSGKSYGDIWSKLRRAFEIWTGLGMSMTGVHTCGDYMFSGHTVVLTMLNFFNTEYTPRKWHLLHTLSWVLNLFGIFFILAAHEHYSIDVFIAFYITTRLFLYYHTLSNTRAVQQLRRTRIWFPLFSFSERNVNRTVPNEFSWPFSRPMLLRTLIR